MKNPEEATDSNVIHLDDVRKIKEIKADTLEEEDSKEDDELDKNFQDSFDQLIEERKPDILDILKEDIKRNNINFLMS